jgi:hypothetical protein
MPPGDHTIWNLDSIRKSIIFWEPRDKKKTPKLSVTLWETQKTWWIPKLRDIELRDKGLAGQVVRIFQDFLSSTQPGNQHYKITYKELNQKSQYSPTSTLHSNSLSLHVWPLFMFWLSFLPILPYIFLYCLLCAFIPCKSVFPILFPLFVPPFSAVGLGWA